MIDISQLPPDQLEYLKQNPAFLEALEAEIPRQVAHTEKRQAKTRRGKVKWQREIDEAMEKAEKAESRADGLRREYDPLLRELSEKYAERLPKIEGTGLICPECGDKDHGNKMNGNPWCMKCQTPLVASDKVAKWVKGKGTKMKMISVDARKLHMERDKQ